MASYTINPDSNYRPLTTASKREAYKYARSITDSTNPNTRVVDAAGKVLAWWRYSPERGGRVYRAVV